MSRSAGPGSPVFFMCAALRRIGRRTSADHRRHVTSPTGRHKAGPPMRNGSIRRVQRAMEYECSCGHVGWSTHIDLAVDAVLAGVLTPEDVASGYNAKRLRELAEASR